MSTEAHSGLDKARRNRRIGLAAGFGALAMLAAAYAAVPIYRLICVATGLNGTTQRADRAPGEIIDEPVRLRLNASVAPGLSWSFRPQRNLVMVRPGETMLVEFEATNLVARATWGTATFNVTPEIAGKYFSKIECFCFSEQELGPGKSARLPVTFFIDPAMTRDPDAAGVEEITLSYTFFPLDKPKKTAIGGSSPAADPAEKVAGKKS